MGGRRSAQRECGLSTAIGCSYRSAPIGFRSDLDRRRRSGEDRHYRSAGEEWVGGDRHRGNVGSRRQSAALTGPLRSDFEVISIEGGAPVKTGIIALLAKNGWEAIGTEGMWALDGNRLLLPVRSDRISK